MTYRAKKVRTGAYTYRGFFVRNASEDVGYTMWNITEGNEFDSFPCEAANSFSQCKAIIDSWIESGDGAPV